MAVEHLSLDRYAEIFNHRDSRFRGNDVMRMVSFLARIGILKPCPDSYYKHTQEGNQANPEDNGAK